MARRSAAVAQTSGGGTAPEQRARRTATSDADPIEWVRSHWEQQGLPDPDRFAAVGSLLRLRELVASEFDRELRSFEINRSMYFLLATLVMSPTGARRLNYLSRYLLVHPTTITLLVDQLEKRGMAKRMPDPRDRRASLDLRVVSGDQASSASASRST